MYIFIYSTDRFKLTR